MVLFPFPNVSEFKVFKKLNTPAKVQDFLSALAMNFETDGETCRSPREALLHGTAHCFEGAALAAAVFWYQGRAPLLLDLETTGADESHVVAPFREGRYWGAVSKTHHSVLRFRDPVYKSIRELAMSYFHEYFLDNGQKTLRRFSKHPLDFRAFADDWLVADYPIWGVHDTLITARHERVASASVLKHLRRADPIEITAGKLVQKKR